MADNGRKPRVAIVGAGFGGIGTAISLLRAGYDDLVILERADAVGGVWRDNTYPGICCDIPAPLYSFSFAPNPDWSRRYPPRDEIIRYLRDVATREGVDQHVRLGVTVHEAAWDTDARRWVLDTSAGEVVADVLVTATGQLSRPRLPALPGMDSFTGPAFHTAQWRHDVDVAGRRVAVVGTGASAIQIVPAIAGVAAQVTVFQRTPPWTLFKADHEYGALARSLRRRLPGIMSLGRLGTWGLAEFLGRALVGNPPARVALSALARGQLLLQVRDRELRRTLTPEYPIGCKRLLFTGEWYPALQRDDVRLVTEEVTEVLPDGVRSADGETHPCDVLVYATGFDATGFVAPMTVRGAGGVTLADTWKDGAHAYLGMTVPDFPNLFVVYGPNTNTGSTSVLYFEEAQAAYITQAVASIERDGPLDVRPEVAHAYDDEVQRRLSESVWVTCSNWYRTATGRVVANWPGMAQEYGRRTRHLDRADFVA
jgi:cation diffusion facilitator CzcD-associated flavoprotein CzcO